MNKQILLDIKKYSRKYFLVNKKIYGILDDIMIKWNKKGYTKKEIFYNFLGKKNLENYEINYLIEIIRKMENKKHQKIYIEILIGNEKTNNVIDKIIEKCPNYNKHNILYQLLENNNYELFYEKLKEWKIEEIKKKIYNKIFNKMIEFIIKKDDTNYKKINEIIKNKINETEKNIMLYYFCRQNDKKMCEKMIKKGAKNCENCYNFKGIHKFTE